jgi:uncharacterized membrane protein
VTSDQQPSIAELIRRLAELSTQIAGLTGEIKDDRRSSEQKYLSRETYQVIREADDRRFKELEGDQKSQADFRRQILAGLVLLFCSSALAIFLALTGLK